MPRIADTTRSLTCETCAVAGVLLLIACVSSAQARVFMRWGAADRGARRLESLGGKQTYEADITLNGGRGHLRIFAFAKEPAQVRRELGRAFDAPQLSAPGTLAFATTRDGNHVLRLVVADLKEYGQTLVFAVDQSAKEAVRSQTPPREAAAGDVPLYPGSRALFFARDHNTRVAMSVHEADADTETIRGYFLSRLVADGWQSGLAGSTSAGGAGPDARGTVSPLTMYVKSGQVCLVLVEPGPSQATTRITVLHKRQRMG